MVGVQPAQEVELLGPGLAGGVELGDRAVHQPEHGGEVFHRRADVGQRRLDPGDQSLLAVGADGAQHHPDHRLAPGRPGLAAQAGAVAPDLDHRVEHGPHRKALVGDLAHDAVHQERRVVLDDLQPVEPGVERRGDADLRGAAAPALGETPEVGEVTGEACGRQLGQFIGQGVGDGLLREGLRALGRSVVAEFGLEGPEQARAGAGAAAHDRNSAPEARTPPEESVRRRLVSPRGSGETRGARIVRGVGGRTCRSADCVA